MRSAMTDVDQVVHGAAITADRARERTAASEIVSVNVGGTVNVLEASRRSGVKRFVYLSSSAVYGDLRTAAAAVDETTAPQPCGESGGFGVTQPGPGSAGNCIPGNLPTVSADNDQQPDTPDAGASVNAEDARRAAGSGITGRITQPGVGEQGIPVEDLPSQSALDRAPVVNPPQH